MIWRVEFDDRARKELRKLDHSVQREILGYLRKRIATKSNPKRFGKPLGGDKFGLWRYRVGTCRIICQIQTERVVVLVLRVGHRRNIYT
ncbi:MAG: type II toxin-antitoxin system RelE/ParE family toxin [Deltaproteobacteria bacterium]|nr:type II toxin-antitoxin system RelE/ParE family toxin [Deltaproteobacteria bacterium]